MRTIEHWIGGAAVAPHGGEYLETLNPATAQPWARIPRGDGEDLDRAVRAARLAAGGWRRSAPSRRAELLWRLAELIEQNADELAELESTDNGKVIREMRSQMRGLPRWWRFAASLCHQLTGDTVPLDRTSVFNYTIREPLGVVGVIVPFNSPILIATFAAASALAAGNTVVVKPSEHASCALLRFAELFSEAGFPDGCFNVVTGYGHEIGEDLVAHPDIAKVVFTGGLGGGRAVATRAAQELKPTLLELGGKSANIVFADVEDLDAAVNGAIAGIFAAAGQTCVAGARLLVQRPIAEEFTQRLVERSRSIVIGDPLLETTQLGPLAQLSTLSRLEREIAAARAGGVGVELGGETLSPEGLGGWFYAPTVLSGLDNTHPLAREELFGPVLCVIPFDSDEEAVAIANDSPYALAAGVWTSQLRRAHLLAAELDAGTVWVNTYRRMNSATTFGGRKLSGYGKEMGVEGLREFTTTKSVSIEMGTQLSSDPFELN